MPPVLVRECHTPGRGAGREVGAGRNKGPDPAQRSSGCSKGPWVNSTVSVMLLVRGGRERNPEVHVSVLKGKSVMDRLGVTLPMAAGHRVPAVPVLTT